MFGVSLILKASLIVGSFIAVPVVAKTLIDNKKEKYVTYDSGALIGPIFDCDNNQSNYKVYLMPNVNNLSETEELDNNINLQIVERKGNKARQVVWGSKDAENKWTQWDIHMLSGDIVKLLPSAMGAVGFEQATNCYSSKVVLKQDKNHGKFWSVEDKKVKERVKFKVDLEACPTKENGECNLVFAENSLFEWSAGFQPKVSIPLEKR